MPEHHYENQTRKAPSGGMNMGKMLIYVTLASVAAIMLFNFYKKSGLADYSHVPEEVQIKYIPADFKPNIDEENALAILSNPYRYEREFNKLIYDFNLSLLFHVANRMGMPDNRKGVLKEEYDKRHNYLKKLYFDEFVALKDTTSTLYKVWYENESTSSVDILNEVASKYTCFVITQVMATMLETDQGKIYVKGSKADTPCGIAMAEALNPLIKRMADRAAILDFSKSKGLMEERVESAIAELATMELRDKKGINRQLQTKIWGFNVSTSDVEVSAISILKVGFKLDRYFDISLNSKRGVVTVTLPEPEILSHEVYPRIDKLDIGWMREVESIDLNKNIELLRQEFKNDAFDSDLMDKAKVRANELMETMLSPLLFAINKKYQLRVQYKKMNPRIEGEEEREQLSESNSF